MRPNMIFGILMCNFLLFVSIQPLYAQKSLEKLINGLSNQDLKYEISKVGVATINDNKLTVPKMLVMIKSINVNSLAKKYKKENLIRHLITVLNDPDKDWYANVLLYAITQKEASPLLAVENRDEWIIAGREQDLKYWNNYLE